MRIVPALLLCLLTVSGGAARAADWSLYWGAEAGLLLPQGERNRTGVQAVGRLGLQAARLPGFAAEAELGTTLKAAQYRSSDLKLTTLAGYLAWRSAGRWYFKVRGGGLWEWTRLGAGRASDGGLSGGFGGGYRFDDGRRLELEFTVIERNVNMLSLSYRF
ncbi:MAG TPA: hypothetical protein VFM15_02930 [Gammaproteobacteria bacterium]|nr:hypothetical protein [Gammaproteobacteria bacterium]